MDFLTQLFSALGTRDSILVLVFLFGAWLIGLLAGRRQLSGRVEELEVDLASCRDALITSRKQAQHVVGTSSQKDDLKKIEGIGPKIEELLNRAGIHTWHKLAQTSPQKISQILLDAGDRFRIHDPTSWPEQAKLLAEGRMDEFQKLTERLVAGKNA
jgi:predicted flap endonuclease-1-like 5' DNA nuclease